MAARMRSAWKKAQKSLAGGVNSPVRAFRAVGGSPVFMERGRGAHLYDIEKRRYIDFCLSWGALLFGHADDATVRAVRAQAGRGTSFGTATEMETALALEIQKAFPGMQRIRFTSSGTEAVMSALRLARGATGRKRILKFEGCYHGHGDSLLVKAGSGLATFGSPDSAGIPPELAKLTSVLPYNDEAALESFFKTNKGLACAIVEPVAANMGVVPATKRFLQLLREGTSRTGALLIFDEVITGFRVGYGGAQHVYGVHPDLTVLGKIIGGGLPVGAFGGRKELMRHLSPEGRVYQAGTLSGNPLSMAAGKSVLSRLSPALYEKLDRSTRDFTLSLGRLFAQKKITASVARTGSMFTVFYSVRTPRDFSEVKRTDAATFRRAFNALLKRGVYTPPSAFEASFLSAAHTPADLEKTLDAYRHI
jgi:glutamate-1-semialdehyde 2,1-aminomutase